MRVTARIVFQGHRDFQSPALPTELMGLIKKVYRIAVAGF